MTNATGRQKSMTKVMAGYRKRHPKSKRKL